jgi:hypothetical protein
MKTQEATSSKTRTSPKKSQPRQGEAKTATKATKSAKSPSAKTAKPAKGKQPKSTSKIAIVLDLLRRENGATLAEIAKATGWQNHSIRGFVSGQVTKKMGLKVESTKSEAGERTYRIL